MIRDSSGGDIAMAAAAPPSLHGSDGGRLAEEVGNSNSGEIEERSSNRGDEGGGGGGGGGSGNYGGNRWPRPETIALLRIRSEMDSVFRDSTPKAPLWEEVSRKLAELGYHRPAKKCKEKFENVYKYHKRTKDGRTAKHDGKTYRFFEELEALEGKQQSFSGAAAVVATPKAVTTTGVITPALPWATTTASAVAVGPNLNNNNATPHQIMATVPSTHAANNITTATATTTSINFTITHPPSNLGPTAVTPAEPISSSQPLNPSPQSVFHPSYHHRQAAAAAAHLFSSSTSSSTASDEEAAAVPIATGPTTRKRKRKWKDFFHKLTKDVIRKQEELQTKFLETVEKLDRERLVREDAWRVQEMARINREHEVLIQERSTAAAKDAAVLALLQKMSGGGGGQQQVPPLSLPPPPQPPPPAQPPQVTTTAPAPTHPAPPQPVLALAQAKEAVAAVARRESGGASSSRWPKAEVLALIALRTRLDEKYQENGPKGPLWEEISGEMKKIGYNRSAKRCKEKWENINKYFKKVKESNKKRPEDSKTCPYFNQLDALYREKSGGSCSSNIKSGIVMSSPTGGGDGSYIAANPLRAVEPMASQPQQQWQTQAALPTRNAEDDDNEEEGYDDDEDDYEDLETEDDEEEEGNGGFQVVQNRSLVANG